VKTVVFAGAPAFAATVQARTRAAVIAPSDAERTFLFVRLDEVASRRPAVVGVRTWTPAEALPRFNL
jgi:hypothetical protein